MLDFVKDHSMLLTTSNSIARDCLCGEAANNGNLHVLEWLWDNGFNHKIIKDSALDAAARQGVVEVLDWVKDHTGDRELYVNVAIQGIFPCYNDFIRRTVLGRVSTAGCG